MDQIFSLIGGAYKLMINVPVFGIGVLIGGFGYRWLLKKNPAMLDKLVTLVKNEATKLESTGTKS
jgi:hypothetical protein